MIDAVSELEMTFLVSGSEVLWGTNISTVVAYLNENVFRVGVTGVKDAFRVVLLAKGDG